MTRPPRGVPCNSTSCYRAPSSTLQSQPDAGSDPRHTQPSCYCKYNRGVPHVQIQLPHHQRHSMPPPKSGIESRLSSDIDVHLLQQWSQYFSDKTSLDISQKCSAPYSAISCATFPVSPEKNLTNKTRGNRQGKDTLGFSFKSEGGAGSTEPYIGWNAFLSALSLKELTQKLTIKTCTLILLLPFDQVYCN